MRLRPWAMRLTLLAALWCGLASASPLTAPDVQAVLQEAWRPAHPDAATRASGMDKAEVRQLVSRHLDRQLLQAARHVAGWTFSLAPAEPAEPAGTPDIGIVLLDYADARTAARLQEQLSRQRRHFRLSKVLTPFASAAAGPQVVIVFTEKAGNAELARLVQTLPAALQARQRAPALAP